MMKTTEHNHSVRVRFVSAMARALVSREQEVKVVEEGTSNLSRIILFVAEDDYGKVIGKNGTHVDAMKDILGMNGDREGKTVILSIPSQGRGSGKKSRRKAPSTDNILAAAELAVELVCESGVVTVRPGSTQPGSDLYVDVLAMDIGPAERQRLQQSLAVLLKAAGSACGLEVYVGVTAAKREGPP